MRGGGILADGPGGAWKIGIGSGGGGNSSATGSGGSTTASSAPSSMRPSITPALTPASRAASDFARAMPSARSSSTRARAAVMRSGGWPASRTPTRSRSAPKCSPMRRHMRSTMPRELSV